MVKELTIYSSCLFQRETFPIESSKERSLSEKMGSVFSSFIETCSSGLQRLGDALLGISKETLVLSWANFKNSIVNLDPFTPTESAHGEVVENFAVEMHDMATETQEENIMRLALKYIMEALPYPNDQSKGERKA